ncbi:MAG: putative transcriptional regulator [Acidimicrobiia bacterium]|nr:putative transcriptional regulator [Acidimicrobiia bacterium]
MATADTSSALSPGEFSAAVSAITSAFGDSTRREIYLFAHEHECGVTASMVAERFGLHANVARHHLEKLTGGGYLDVAVDRGERAGAGRPSKRYRAGNQVSLELPVKTDDLVLTLLGRALALVPPELARQMAEEVGLEYGRAMGAAMGAEGAHRSLQSAQHSVADALTAHGFAAHTEKRGNQLNIVNNHCPFGETAIEHPVICAVDRGMVKGMLEALYGEATPETAASLPQGDAVCVTAFS